MKINRSCVLTVLLSAALMAGAAMAAAKDVKKDKTPHKAEEKSTASPLKPSENDEGFYVYSDRGSRLNHYIASGWMGDYGDLKLNQGWVKENISKESNGSSNEVKSVDGKEPQPMEDTCMQIKYTAERKQGQGWAGIYWQHPANNWGDKKGGYDLSKYSKLTLMARGEVGDETIDKFQVGGITGQMEDGDSDSDSISPVKLTKEWKKYEVSLKGLDLKHIIGGFCFAANADANPDGFTMYLDEVKFEK